VTVNIIVFGDVMRCSLVDIYSYFSGVYYVQPLE